MIEYRSTPTDLQPDQLDGFFVGWPSRPTPELHLQLLRLSQYVEIAVDPETRKVVGFATAVSDRVLAAHITFLEVLPDYQHRGIATRLMQGLLMQTAHLYAISLQCDHQLKEFYEEFGFRASALGMGIWRTQQQSGSSRDARS
jgi:ribosomal protein S18 acetylase RimI-like enzyme